MSGTRRKLGRMGPYVNGFETRLLELSYTPGTVRNALKDVGNIGRWLEEENLDVSELTKESLEAFVCARRSTGRRRVLSVRSFAPLLDYLRSEGVIAPETVPSTPVGDLVALYTTWLVVERGLADPTVLRYGNSARRFLEERLAADGNRFVEDLTGAAVVGFLLRECPRVSVGAAKGRVAELRSLLRFLYLKGLTPLPLATAVPPVAGWHDTGVPAGISPSDVQHLLEGCDRSASGGIRDFAILTLVARLGLRSAEVARLELDDVVASRLALRRDEVDETLFELTTLWRSMEAIRKFAGEDYTRAVLYENDEQYFLRWDERVEHFEVTSLEDLNQQVALGS